MKIGYDAKRAFLNNTGLGNYSRWLIKSLAEQEQEQAYYLYTPKTKPNDFLQLFKSLPTVNICLPKSKSFTSWWRSKGIIADLKRDQIELYHGLSHELPVGIARSGIASIVTVHDVIALRFPEYFSWINRKIYVAKLRHACRVANHIVAISQQTQQDLVSLLSVDAKKISVIYQGCNPVFGIPVDTDQQQQVRQKYNLPQPYLLTVGTIERRKNLLLLAKALNNVDADINLVVVGKPTEYLNEVKAYLKQHQLTNRVLFLHQVPFSDLPVIYQMAKVFVYPSRYEGFGIPVLEALNAGVPVIAATDSCLEEAGGPDSLYVQPDDEKDLARNINQLWNDATLRQYMIAQGRIYATNFSDRELASQMIHLYQQTLQKHA